MKKRSKKTRMGEARRIKAVSYLYRRGFTKKEILKFARLQRHKYKALHRLNKKNVRTYWNRVNSRRARNARRNFIQEAKFQKKFLKVKEQLMRARLPKRIAEDIFEEGS